MKPMSHYVALAALSLGAAAVVLPTAPAFAQDQQVQYKRVTENDLPKAVKESMDRETRDTRDKLYHRQTRDGKTFYSVHYTKGDKRMEVRLDESGKVVDGPHESRAQADGKSDGDLERVARPADDNVDDVGVKFHRISPDDVRREVPKDVLKTMDKYTEGKRDLDYQRQLREGKTFYSVHYTGDDKKRMFIRVDDKGKLALGPEVSRPSGQADARRDTNRGERDSTARRSPSRAPTSEGANAAVKVEEIGAGDLPANVRQAVEQATAGGSEHRFVKETIGNEVTYFVEYTKDGTRTNARVAADGKVLAGGAGAVAALKQEEIGAGDLPADVRQTVERATAGGSEHKFVKETMGDKVTYFVEYTMDGRRTNALVAADGKLLGGGNSAIAAAPTPAPAPAPGEPQVAAAREAAAGPYQLLTDPGQLPAEARAAVEKASPGATDSIFQRFTRDNQTVYSVHFTTPEGQRQFMAVDQAGKVAIQPRKSNWQEGGKGTKFEVIAPAQLPAEVRTQIEQATQGGSDHLFIGQTRPNGQASYHVQYTAADGERMEIQVNANGKLVEKPRKAHEQPFTILDRKE